MPFTAMVEVTVEPMADPECWRVTVPDGPSLWPVSDETLQAWGIEPPPVLHRVEVLLTDDVVRARGTTGAIRATAAYVAGSSALDAACAELVAELDAAPEPDEEPAAAPPTVTRAQEAQR